MLPPQIVPFLIIVVLSVAGALAFAFLFVVLSPWVRQHMAALLKEPTAKKHP